MRTGWATGIVFTALLLLAPWPWYLFAVGGLLPVAVILLIAAMYTMQHLVLAVMLAVCALLGIAAFWLIARWFAGRWARPWAVAGFVGLLVAVSFLPIYGGGENIATPAGKFTDAYTAYAKEADLARCRVTAPRDTRRC